MADLTVAVCTHNRADWLSGMVAELRRQECAVPFSILIIDNKSSDHTQKVLSELASREGAPLRHVYESVPGIVPARNRAITESLTSTYLVFLDDDELPKPGMLSAALDAFDREGAECVGGRIQVAFKTGDRPKWLCNEILGFVGELDHGNNPFWIDDNTTPLFTGNIAYRTSIFQDGLRFDHRYNRIGQRGFGGEDLMMLAALLGKKTKIRYRPDMQVEHYPDKLRLTRKYFLRLHYREGLQTGRWQTKTYHNTYWGIPLFMVWQAFRHTTKASHMYITRNSYAIRQAMNAAHAFGMIVGRYLRWRTRSRF